eukprot:scaffold260375_cov27-Tisochrysis_lutea.AAC.3
MAALPAGQRHPFRWWSGRSKTYPRGWSQGRLEAARAAAPHSEDGPSSPASYCHCLWSSRWFAGVSVAAEFQQRTGRASTRSSIVGSYRPE